jgi:SsrA-binding protein
MYFRKGRLKVELALAKGKKHYDRREKVRERDLKREVQAELKERNR